MSQYNKLHAATVVAAAALLANRFIAYDGGYATSAGGLKDAQGVSEVPAAVGEALPVVTSYSYPVEASAAISAGAYVKPAADGSGRAAVGTVADCCGIALEAAGAAGALIECRLFSHRRPAA